MFDDRNSATKGCYWRTVNKKILKSSLVWVACLRVHVSRWHCVLGGFIYKHTCELVLCNKPFVIVAESLESPSPKHASVYVGLHTKWILGTEYEQNEAQSTLPSLGHPLEVSHSVWRRTTTRWGENVGFTWCVTAVLQLCQQKNIPSLLVSLVWVRWPEANYFLLTL